MAAPLVPVTCAFILGIGLGHLFCDGLANLLMTGVMLVLCGTLSLVGACWNAHRRRSGMFALLTCWVCLGMLRWIVWRAHPDASLAQRLTDEPQSVCVHGLIIDDPEQLVVPEGQMSQRGTLALRHVHTAEGWRPITGRVRLTIDHPRCVLAYGDEALLEGAWSLVPSPGNPGQYDWRAALARQEIHGVLRVRASNGVVVLTRHHGHPMVAAVFRLRRHWERLIRSTWAPREAGLLCAVLLGERVALEDELKRAFVETGTVHLLVISGFNVGLVAGLLTLLVRLIGLPWRLQLVLIAISLGGYCLLTGVQPPVVRATIMAWMVLGAYALDRVVSWFNTLAAAALVILWLNPSQLFDPSFQLSFGAVLSLLLFTPRWHEGCEQRWRWMRPVWVRRYLAMSLAATSAIWLGLSPILAWYFYLVSPVSMLANLLIAPLISALVSMGTALLLVGSACPVFLRWGRVVLTTLLHLTLGCVSWCHALPGGYWYVGHPALLWLMGYYTLVAVSMLRARLRLTVARLVVCWLVGVGLWTWSGVIRRAHDARWLRVDVLDVGHGDCIVVRTPRGQTLLVDTGSQAAGRSRVIPFLRHAGITTLDALVLTHSDEDHLGGAIPLLDAVRVKRLFTNGAQDDTTTARTVRQRAAARHLEPTVLVDGMRLGAETGIEITVLHPPRGFVRGTSPVSNDNCVVVKATMGSVSVLLTGDIEEAGLPWLLRAHPALRATVLKVPHHGSRLGQAGERFFEAVHPQVAILSVGRIHHLPAPQTLRALATTGATVYLTRDDGAIQLKTDGRNLEVRSFKHPTQGQQLRCDPVACEPETLYNLGLAK